MDAGATTHSWSLCIDFWENPAYSALKVQRNSINKMFSSLSMRTHATISLLCLPIIQFHLGDVLTGPVWGAERAKIIMISGLVTYIVTQHSGRQEVASRHPDVRTL